MHRSLIFVMSAFGCVSSTPDPASKSCEETASPIDPDESTAVGLTAGQAVASFPSDWDVTWSRPSDDPTTATQLSDPQDTVTVSLALVSAEEVVSNSDAGWCHAEGTTFLRLHVAGEWAADDGLTSGTLEGVLEIEAGQDPLTWAVNLSAPSLTLVGEDRDQAEQFAAEAGIVRIEEIRGAVVAHWQGVRPLEFGLDVVGEVADGGSKTHGLWGSVSATPSE